MCSLFFASVLECIAINWKGFAVKWIVIESTLSAIVHFFFADVFIKWRLLLHYKVLLTNQSNLVFVNRLEWLSHAEIQLVYVCLSHECQSPPKCRCRHQNSCCLRPTFFKLCKDRITNDDVDDRVLCTKDQRKGELQFSSFSSLTITNSMHKQFAFWPYLKRNCLFALREKLSDVTSLRPYLFEAFSRLSLFLFLDSTEEKWILREWTFSVSSTLL